MGTELVVLTLLRAEIAASLAILLVLVLRAPTRRLIGPALACRLWSLVPAAVLASAFPPLADFLQGEVPGAAALAAPSRLSAAGGAATADLWALWAPGLARVWLAGAALLALVFLASELRLRRRARAGLVGPAVVGVAAPRLVVPWDYAARFTAEERAFIRRHERAHMARGDTMTNFLVAGAQAIGWFNPLMHLAAGAVRLDQELACDALALEGRAGERRAYAQALLRAHGVGRADPLACAWSPAGVHPLELRLRTLRRERPSLRRAIQGVVGVAALALGLAATVWVLAPRQVAAPPVSEAFRTAPPAVRPPAPAFIRASQRRPR